MKPSSPSSPLLQKVERFLDAVDERTGLRTNLQHFLYEEIPASSGWHQVLGSVALFMILVQMFTGIMLSFNYAPTPGDAYASLRYILTEVTAGRLMRGLHHWGASMIIVIVVLHMVQVFIWGAYKKPREGTWIVGCVLLLLTLAYGLTGYLLPWDNRAYWGTTVTAHIGATAPLAGPYITRLLATSGNDISVITFARFYSVHVLLLPPITLLLIAFHVYLVRKHGVAPSIGDELKPKKSFFPEQVAKDTIAVFIAFAILFTMAIAVRVPLERMADPTDTSYTPRPEWYFLFLFQTLKLFPGSLEIVGSMVLPTLAILALILTPFIDRSRMVKLRQRTLAVGVVVLAAIGWGSLTAVAVAGTPEQTAANKIDFSGPIQWMSLAPGEMAAVKYYREANCAACHNIGDGPPKSGPNLMNAGRRHDADWILQHFKNPSAVTPNSQMTPVNLPDRELRDLATLMLRLTPENEDVVDTAPNFAVEGAALYQKDNCGACHSINGSGGSSGPPLNGVGSRRTEAWVAEHFQNPKKLSPGSFMPPYAFSAQDMQNMTSYLFTLPDKAPAK